MEHIPSFQHKAELNLRTAEHTTYVAIQRGLLGKFAIFVYQVSAAHHMHEEYLQNWSEMEGKMNIEELYQNLKGMDCRAQDGQITFSAGRC